MKSGGKGFAKYLILLWEIQIYKIRKGERREIYGNFKAYSKNHYIMFVMKNILKNRKTIYKQKIYCFLM